jgi:hypothetical protein
MPIAVLELSGKEARMMHLWAKMRSLDEEISRRLEPLMAIRDIGMLAMQNVVFGDAKEDAAHEIKLDPNHSVVFSIKDGKFDYEMTCTCDHEDHPEEEQDGLSALLTKVFADR